MTQDLGLVKSMFTPDIEKALQKKQDILNNIRNIALERFGVDRHSMIVFENYHGYRDCATIKSLELSNSGYLYLECARNYGSLAGIALEDNNRVYLKQVVQVFKESDKPKEYFMVFKSNSREVKDEWLYGLEKINYAWQDYL